MTAHARHLAEMRGRRPAEPDRGLTWLERVEPDPTLRHLIEMRALRGSQSIIDRARRAVRRG